MEDRNSMMKFFSYSIKVILFSVKDLLLYNDYLCTDYKHTLEKTKHAYKTLEVSSAVVYWPCFIIPSFFLYIMTKNTILVLLILHALPLNFTALLLWVGF